MKTFAVDADIIAYRSASVTTIKAELIDIIDNTLGNIVAETGVRDMRLYLSGDANFRYEVAKTKPYKGNRTSDKPLLLRAARDYLRLEHGALVVDGYEADDAIASDMVLNGAMHCGVDKDILQVAGRHYNYVKKKFVDVPPEQALVNLYTQVIVGDSTDNIGGLKGYGAVKAADIIAAGTDPEAQCKLAYMEALGDDWIEYYNEQLALVKLVTDLSIVDIVTKRFEARLF